MPLTNDIKTFQVLGSESQLISAGVAATVTVYVGGVALISAGTAGGTIGFLKNAGTPSPNDIVAGIVDGYAGGTGVATAPGVVGGATDGAVWANIKTGTFLMLGNAGIAGATALTAANNGKPVFYAGETASGPVASASSNTGAFPALGVQLPQDPGFAGGFLPGAAYWPIEIGRALVGSP
jgi:hypothetical protein